MNNRMNLRLCILCVLFAASALCHADMKITIRTVSTETPARAQVANPLVSIYYRSGSMRRKDHASDDLTPPVLSSLANCAAKTGFLVDMNSHEYRSYSLPKSPTAADLHEYLQNNPSNPYHIALVQVESRTVDTGERKSLLGFEAKHFITTTTRAADDSNAGGEDITDGWYIDHDQPDYNCTPDSVSTEPNYVIPTLLAEPKEFAEFHHTGPLPMGLAVKEKHTVHFNAIKGEKAARSVEIEKTVEELSDSALKISTFELPSGLKENPELFRKGWRESGPTQAKP